MLALASLAASIVIGGPWPNGGTIPKRYTCDGAGARPRLTFAARTFALEVLDPDAPGGSFVHWLEAGPVQGRNSAGGIGWTPPCPPRGDPPHRYVFRVYELDRRPVLRPGFTDVQLRRAIRGHVVARGTYTGRYGR